MILREIYDFFILKKVEQKFDFFGKRKAGRDGSGLLRGCLSDSATQTDRSCVTKNAFWQMLTRIHVSNTFQSILPDICI